MEPTRDRIVTAASELFRRRGFNGTSVKDVTVVAQVTMGSLYHFFPDGKEQLTAEVLRSTGAVYLELFEAIAADAGDIGRAVRQFFDGAAEVLAVTDYIDICPIGSIAREVASTNEVLRVTCAEVFASWHVALSGHLRDAGLTPAVTRRTAAAVIASLEGGFILSRATRDPQPLHDVGIVMRGVVDAAVRDATTRVDTRRAPARQRSVIKP